MAVKTKRVRDDGMGKGFKLSEDPMTLTVTIKNPCELLIAVWDEDEGENFDPMGFFKDEAEALIETLREMVDRMDDPPSWM